MVLGTGMAFLEVKPYEALLSLPDESLLELISAEELTLIRSRRSGAESLAARVAARKAACEALQWSYEETPAHAFKIHRLSSGQPVMEVQEAFRGSLDAHGSPQLLLSLTHGGGYAMALVFVQTSVPA